MAQLKQDFLFFWKRKGFAYSLLLIAVLSFATQILNPTVGIDDTSFKIYFVDGVSPAVGRWCIFLLNKIFPLAYNPYFVEMVGIGLFCISVSLWCVVLYRVMGERVPFCGYVAFACVMISSPMLSELEVWYLQNGTHIAYGVTALAVLCLLKALEEEKTSGKNGQEKSGRKEDSQERNNQEMSSQKRNSRARSVEIKQGACSIVLLTVAIGFYESFMIVFLAAVFLLFFLVRAVDTRYTKKPLSWFLKTVCVLGLSMLLREGIVRLLTVIFHLEPQRHVLETRGLGDMLQTLFSGEGVVLLLKDFFVKYYLNAIVYVPVMILVLAMMVLFCAGAGLAVYKKDGWIFAAFLAVVITPLLLALLEGNATYYRTAQYVPLVTAFAVFVLFWLSVGVKSRVIRFAGIFLLFVLLYRQGYEMNRWMYLDAMKYEDAKRTMDSVALYIRQNLDDTLPVCVIGEYEVPEALAEEAYCPDWSKKYMLMEKLVSAVDTGLWEKYSTPEGYAAAETPLLSVVKWGARAFYGFDRELVKFWKMHGITLYEDGNQSHYEEAQKLFESGPVWPEEGSVVEAEGYIIVNFGNSSAVQE